MFITRFNRHIFSVTEEIIKSTFDDINVAVNNEKSILILDKYHVHTTDNVKEYAESKNISLIYVR